jgi:hypothetical protein
MTSIHHFAGPLDMNWPIQLCVGNVINELLFGYHFPVDDCDKYLRFCDHLNEFAKLFGNRKTVLLCQAYPWMRHLPIIGYYGCDAILLLFHFYSNKNNKLMFSSPRMGMCPTKN